MALDDQQLSRISRSAHRREYRPGETIFDMGEPSRGLFCVSAGAVAVRKLASGGQSVVLSLAYPGEILGYRSLLNGGHYKTSAEAIEPSVVCRIDHASVTDVLRQNPDLGLRLLNRAAREVEDAHNAILDYATLSNRCRLLRLLVEMSGRHSRPDTDGSLLLDLPVCRRDLAAMIGTRQETLSRIIGRIEEEGLASFSGRRVHVPQIDPLLRELEVCRMR